MFSEVDRKTACADPLPALVRRVRALAGLADAWRSPRSPWMRRARREIPTAFAFSSPMVEACLRTTFAGWTLASVARWVHDDLPSRLRQRAAARCARGLRAREVLLVLPSTVFAAAWQAAAAVWLAGFVPVFRPSRREPIFARLLAESARAMGGRDLPFRLLAPGTPVNGRKKFRAVVAYGSDPTVIRLRATTERGRKIFGFGTQVGAAWISRRALSHQNAANLARGLARDVVLYETQGCLSPGCIFVDRGAKVSPRAFAALVAKEIARLDRAWTVRGEDALAGESFLQLWKFRAAQGRAEFFGRHVILHGEHDFAPSGLRRVVFVRPVAGPGEAARLCAHWPAKLAVLGLADASETVRVGRAFRSHPDLWMAAIGRMHEPPPSWRNGGVSLLQELAAG